MRECFWSLGYSFSGSLKLDWRLIFWKGKSPIFLTGFRFSFNFCFFLVLFVEGVYFNCVFKGHIGGSV